MSSPFSEFPVLADVESQLSLESKPDNSIRMQNLAVTLIFGMLNWPELLSSDEACVLGTNCDSGSVDFNLLESIGAGSFFFAGDDNY